MQDFTLEVKLLQPSRSLVLQGQWFSVKVRLQFSVLGGVPEELSWFPVLTCVTQYFPGSQLSTWELKVNMAVRDLN